MTRYARQELIIGTDGQSKLAQSHVLVVGAGGLGCPVLQYLVGAGVGEITLMDDDVVAQSNLHRQPLYRMQDIDQPKALAAVSHLQASNPDVRLHPHLCRLTPATAVSAVAQADVVIDAADSFAVSYILSDTCMAAGKPLVSASVLGQSGYVGAYCGGGPSLRAVFPDLPETAGSCASAGVLGPVVGMVGSCQAQLALSLLTGQSPAPIGQLMTIDMASLRLGGFSFASAPEPAEQLGFVALDQLLLEDQLIELRPEVEAKHPFADTANRILPSELHRADLDPKRRVVLGCQTGLRSWKAGRALQEQGFASIALFACSAG